MTILFALAVPAWLQAVGSYEASHYGSQLAYLISILPSLIVALTPYPRISAALKKVSWFLNLVSIFTHKDSPGTLKLPLTQSQPPPGAAPILVGSNAVKIAILFALLVPSVARAQTFSAGLSVPILEFKVKGSQPVQLAPGTGVQANVCFFPTTLLGEEVELLCLGAAGFGTAPGSLQLALIASTFNGMVGAGAATPLVAADGSGLFQGSFNVLPIISGGVAFSLYSAPPEATGASPGQKRRRFGTVYLGLLQGRE